MNKIINKFIFVLCLMFLPIGILCVGCGETQSPTDPKYQVTFNQSQDFEWDMGFYGEHIHEGEFYFISNGWIIRDTENPLYFFLFDTNITEILINEQNIDFLTFTSQEIKNLYFKPNDPNYIFNDLYGKNEITGNLGDQEERFMPVSMSYHEKVIIAKIGIVNTDIDIVVN